MARPIKNNCDYFSHDNNMRNHVKIKAIRQKFPNGYAIWVMFLEYLTGADGNVFECNELNIELLSGDFGFTPDEIKNVIDYAIKLEMISIDSNNFINSPSLDERLSYVYEKRGQAKKRSEKQNRVLGKFSTEKTDDTVVSVTETPISATETPQSKVNKSKVNKNYKKLLLSELSDSDVDNVEYLKITKAFYKLIKNNIIEKGLPENKINEAKGTWYDDIRLLIEVDGASKENLLLVYDFLKKNDFWKGNILSTSSLRKKFIQLAMAAKTPKTSKPEEPVRDLPILNPKK